MNKDVTVEDVAVGNRRLAVLQELECLEHLPEKAPDDDLWYAFLQANMLRNVAVQITAIAKLPVCNGLFDISVLGKWRIVNQSYKVDKPRDVRVRSVLGEIPWL